MREFKFRAWNVRDEKMEFNVHTNFSTKEGTSKAVKQGYRWNDFENTDTVYDSKLMQYVERKDKNDVEIFEGDLVKAFSKIHDDTERINQVVYSNGSFRLRAADDYITDIPIGNYSSKNMEVIGNIYENPDWREEK